MHDWLLILLVSPAVNLFWRQLRQFINLSGHLDVKSVYETAYHVVSNLVL
jgi:hypothetical protein